MLLLYLLKKKTRSKTCFVVCVVCLANSNKVAEFQRFMFIRWKFATARLILCRPHFYCPPKHLAFFPECISGLWRWAGDSNGDASCHLLCILTLFYQNQRWLLMITLYIIRVLLVPAFPPNMHSGSLTDPISGSPSLLPWSSSNRNGPLQAGKQPIGAAIVEMKEFTSPVKRS